MLLAYHNDPAIKQKYVKRVRLHQLQDEIIQGYYWQHGKGCAVGCTIHSSDHAAYETELGVPLALAYLQDRIFEGLSNEEAKSFPLAFLEAIPIGADLTSVLERFLLWLLIDEQAGVLRFARTDEQKQAIQGVADLYAKKLTGETILLDEWRMARSFAYAAAADAAYAAADAADAADAAYAAADAAADAAYAAADAADADAYADAADADAYAAADDDAADAAYAAAADADADAYAAADDDAAYAADAAAGADAADYAAARKQYYSVMKTQLLTLLTETARKEGE